MTKIISKEYDKTINFADLPVGTFFAIGMENYVKINREEAFNLHAKIAEQFRGLAWTVDYVWQTCELK